MNIAPAKALILQTYYGKERGKQEEHVRQYLIKLLHEQYNYPLPLMAVEKQVTVGDMMKRFDIVIYDRDEHKPWMLAECKAPDVPVSKHTLHQLLNYQRVMRCRYWLLSNGHQTICADACTPDNIEWLISLPAYDM